MKIAVGKYEETLLSEILNVVKSKFDDEKDINLWMYLTVMTLKERLFLKEFLKVVREQGSISYSSDYIQCTYEDEGKYIIKVAGAGERMYDADTIQSILSVIISVIEPVLPLGTVVKLKKESMKSLLEYVNNNSENEKILLDDVIDTELIIDKRFIDLGKDEKYAEYSASIYPMSSAENVPQFIFTNEDIDEILYKGYSNEKETSCVCLMKCQLIRDGKTSAITINN